jgi:hypothetical protein
MHPQLLQSLAHAAAPCHLICLIPNLFCKSQSVEDNTRFHNNLLKMGKQKKTRKFAEVKRLLNPKDVE